MSMFFFTYRAQTQARRGASILKEAGIHGRMDRTPSKMAVNGCGYGLWVPETQGYGAALELRGRGCPYERSYRWDGKSAKAVTL